MCWGGGGYTTFKEEKEGPIWRVTKDKKHITFYGDYSLCTDATTWCKNHCYMQLLPPTMSIQKPKYKIEWFEPGSETLFMEDLKKAEFVTFLASGLLRDNFPGWGETPIIKKISLWYPQKIFRFYLRHTDGLKMIPLNARTIFSADCKTHPDIVDKALKENGVRLIGIVDHPDNRILIAYVESHCKKVITCQECNDNYDCFKPHEKTLVLMKYIK